MSEAAEAEADTQEVNRQQARLLELLRIAYAFGLGASVATAVGIGVSVLGVQQAGIPFEAILVLFFLLPVGLYIYDRQHERDLIIADRFLFLFRPLIILYRIFRAAVS